MDPESQVLNSRLAITYFWQGDMANARRYYDIANTMGTGAPIHQLSYALFLIREGRIDGAREVTRRAMLLFQADTDWVDPVFNELRLSPKSAAMRSVLQENSAQIPAGVLVALWAIAGQSDEVMKIAWRLVEDPSYFDIEMIWLDEFSVPRQHADFPQLLNQLGLTDYWMKVGCRWDVDRLHCPTS
jgi:tetratricopeptide (TPR) repeat protein